MKLYKSIFMGVLGMAALSSCSDYLDINTNPNTPSAESAQYQFRLPWALHYSQAGYEIGASVSTYFSGLLTTTSAREGGAARWNLGASTRANNMQQWFLVPVGSNIGDLEEKAMAAGAYHYAACAKYMRAFGFMEMLDAFGECPYTEALGEATSPKYDDPKEVFMACISEIEAAIELFSKPQEPGAVALAVGDNWNNGDVNKWIKYCYLLKARWLNHLTKKQPGNYKEGKYDEAEILACLAKAQQSNADNTVLYHTDTNGNTHDVEGWDETVDYNTIFSCVGMNNNRYYVTKTFYDNLTNFDNKGIEDPRADKFIPWVRSKKSANTPAEIKWDATETWRRSLGVDIVNGDIYMNGTGPVAIAYTVAGTTNNNTTYPSNAWYCNTSNDERKGDTIYVHGKSSSKGYDNNKDLLYRVGGSSVDGSAVSGVFSVRPDSPTYMGSYWEACFIKAEVLMRKGDKQGAYAAYKEGVKANIEAVEAQCAKWVAGDPSLASCPSFAPAAQADIDAYLATALGTEADITMSKIISQKLMTELWSAEAWNDMRRFDYDPNIFMNYNKPYWYQVTGSAKTYCPEGRSPRRLPQASYETSYNVANLEASKQYVPGGVDHLNVKEGGAWFNADDVRTLNIWWDSTAN